VTKDITLLIYAGKSGKHGVAARNYKKIADLLDRTTGGDPKLKRRRNNEPNPGNSVEGSLVGSRGRHARG